MSGWSPACGRARSIRDGAGRDAAARAGRRHRRGAGRAHRGARARAPGRRARGAGAGRHRRRPRPHRALQGLSLRHGRASLLHQGRRGAEDLAGGPRRRIPAAPPAVADLLQRPVLQLPAQAAQRAGRAGPRAGRARHAQLSALAALPVHGGAHLRAVGDQPVRPAPVRDLLQDLYREGLGHLVLGAARRVGGPADQGPVAPVGGGQHVREAAADDQDPHRGVRLPAAGAGHDVARRGRRDPPAVGRRSPATARSSASGAPAGTWTAWSSPPTGARRRSRAISSSPACR